MTSFQPERGRVLCGRYFEIWLRLCRAGCFMSFVVKLLWISEPHYSTTPLLHSYPRAASSIAARSMTPCRSTEVMAQYSKPIGGPLVGHARFQQALQCHPIEACVAHDAFFMLRQVGFDMGGEIRRLVADQSHNASSTLCNRQPTNGRSAPRSSPRHTIPPPCLHKRYRA